MRFLSVAKSEDSEPPHMATSDNRGVPLDLPISSFQTPQKHFDTLAVQQEKQTPPLTTSDKQVNSETERWREILLRETSLAKYDIEEDYLALLLQVCYLLFRLIKVDKHLSHCIMFACPVCSYCSMATYPCLQ